MNPRIGYDIWPTLKQREDEDAWEKFGVFAFVALIVLVTIWT